MICCILAIIMHPVNNHIASMHATQRIAGLARTHTHSGLDNPDVRKAYADKIKDIALLSKNINLHPRAKALFESFEAFLIP